MKRVALTLLAVLVGSAAADSIDYARYVAVVTVEGFRPSPGLEAPERLTDRARRLLEPATYDRDYTVGDFLAVNTRRARRFERMTLEHRRGEVRYTSDGGTDADFEFPLTGAVMEQLLPVPGPRQLLGRVACPCCGREWPEGQPVPDQVEPVPFEEEDLQNFTGVLVDVQGLEFGPALFPRLVNEAGLEAYGPAFADEDAVIERGLAGYYRNRNEALLDGRVGSNPLLVRAVAVEGQNRCEAVVSARDAARIHGSTRNLSHLARCRVGFLTD